MATRKNKKILIVEDEKDLVKLLAYNLEKEGFTVVSASDGEAGLALFKKEKPDFAILDIMLPKLNGIEILKTIRQASKTPVLMLTAKKEEIDRILGLELGADDYVTKPFSVREVIARVHTILRRLSEQRQAHESIVHLGEVVVDLERYETRLNDTPINLSSKEFEFLKYLIEADGKAITRDKLLEMVWGMDSSLEIDTRTVDQHVSRLRDKLGPESKRVVTVKNVGYRLKMD